MSRIPAGVVAEVEERASWACEACGTTLAGKADLHHRFRRGMGGNSGDDLDVAVNLIRVHHLCHMWIHAHPDVAREHGWIVSSLDESRTVRVRVSPALRRWAKVS